jgi:hypothetical protein
MDGSEFQTSSHEFILNDFHILHVEDKFDGGLPASLALGGLMDHQIGAAVRTYQLDDSVFGLSRCFKIEMFLVEAGHLFDVVRVKHYSVYRQSLTPRRYLYQNKKRASRPLHHH